jgi:outer membrane protein
MNSRTLKSLFRVATMLTLLFCSVPASAQKYAYVNTQYILDNIPDYKAAQQQLDQIAAQWQKEIEDKYAIIDKLYKAYESEQILLTEEMKKKRRDEIMAKEKDVKELQKQRFGYEGDLFKKKQELIKPIQDKVYNAVKKIAIEGSYAVIFDKSSDLTMLYANPKYDKSDDVLTALGYKPGKKEGSDTKPDGTKGTPKPAQQGPSEEPQQQK